MTIGEIMLDALRNPEKARYVYTTEPVPREDAERWHREGIRTARARLQEAAAELKEAIAAPLQKTRSKQIRLLPGDPGYDEAGTLFSPTDYQGDVVMRPSPWLELTTPKETLETML